MKTLFLIIFIGVEMFGWWLSLTDIKECLRKKMTLLSFSKIWILVHIFGVLIYSFLKYGGI